MTNEKFLEGYEFLNKGAKFKKYSFFSVSEYLDSENISYKGEDDFTWDNELIFHYASSATDEKLPLKLMNLKTLDSQEFENILNRYNINTSWDFKDLFSIPTNEAFTVLDDFHYFIRVPLFEALSKEASMNKNVVIAPSVKNRDTYLEYPYSSVPNLYNELSKVILFDDKSLNYFVNKYGLIIETNMLAPRGLSPESSTRTVGIDLAINFNFHVNLELARFKAYRKLVVDFLKNRITHNDRFYDLLLENEVPVSMYYDEIEGSFIPTIGGKSIIDVAYIQLIKALINKVTLEKCLYCNHYFEKTHHRQEFCPPHPGLTRSSCKTAYHREEKKKKKGE